MARTKKKNRKSKTRRKWNIGNYARYVKAARREGLNTDQARTSYRLMRGKLGRSVRASDIKKHPREFNNVMSELSREAEEAGEILEQLEDLLDDQAPGLQTLVDRHYGEKGYGFDLEGSILKVSISTVKTRKSFSIRLS